MEGRVNPKIIRHHILLLFGGQALISQAFQFVPAIGPLIILKLTDSVALSGLALSISWLGRLITAYPTGKLLDRFGRAKVLALGFAVATLGFLSTSSSVVAGSFPWFVASLILVGFGMGAVNQNRVAASDIYPTLRRSTGVGYLMTASVVGAVIAPFIISFNQWYAGVQGWNVYSLIWIVAALTVIPGIALSLMLRPDPRDISIGIARHEENNPGDNATLTGGASSIDRSNGLKASIKDYPILTATIVIASTQGIMAMMMGLAAVIMVHHDISLTLITAAVSVHVIGMFGFSIPLGRLSDRLGRRRTLVFACITSAVGGVMLPATENLWIIVTGYFFVGLGWSAGMVAGTSVIADVTRAKERGKLMGLNDLFTGVTAVSFPIIGGIIMSILGYMSLGYLSIVVVIPALIFAGLLHEVKPGVYHEHHKMSMLISFNRRPVPA